MPVSLKCDVPECDKSTLSASHILGVLRGPPGWWVVPSECAHDYVIACCYQHFNAATSSRRLLAGASSSSTQCDTAPASGPSLVRL